METGHEVLLRAFVSRGSSNVVFFSNGSLKIGIEGFACVVDNLEKVICKVRLHVYRYWQPPYLENMLLQDQLFDWS